jgi:hypothetical protein
MFQKLTGLIDQHGGRNIGERFSKVGGNAWCTTGRHHLVQSKFL